MNENETNERGIVISPDFSIKGRTAIFNELIAPKDLRKYLMYWDKIDIPLCGTVAVSSDDVDFLEREGVVHRTRHNFLNTTRFQFEGQWKNIGIPYEIALEISEAHESTFGKYQDNSPGQWCKGYLQHELSHPNQVSASGIEIDLYNVLPVPVANTPLDDILKFKAKRADELTAFRIHMDDIRERVVSSSDIPRKRSTERMRLESSLNDLKKLMREHRIRTAKSSLRAVVSNVGEVAVSITAGQIAGVALGFTSNYGGLAAGGLKIGYLAYNAQSNPYPFELNYLKSAISNFKTK